MMMSDLQTKRCTKCSEEYSLDAFHNDKSRSDGKFPQCKTCVHADQRRRYAENPEKAKAETRAWAIANPEKRRAIERRNAEKNKDRNTEAKRRWAIQNPDKTREVAKVYRDSLSFETKRDRANRYRSKYRQKILIYERRWRAENPEKQKAKQQRSYHSIKADPQRLARYREKNNVISAARNARMTDDYIRKLIVHDFKVKLMTDIIPVSLIELKRVSLMIKRQLKKGYLP